MKLIKNKRKRLIIEVASSVVFLLVAVLFLVLYFRSQTVEPAVFGDQLIQHITYNDLYANLFYFCLNVSIASAIILVTDLVFSQLLFLLQKRKKSS